MIAQLSVSLRKKYKKLKNKINKIVKISTPFDYTYPKNVELAEFYQNYSDKTWIRFKNRKKIYENFQTRRYIYSTLFGNGSKKNEQEDKLKYKSFKKIKLCNNLF